MNRRSSDRRADPDEWLLMFTLAGYAALIFAIYVGWRYG